MAARLERAPPFRRAIVIKFLNRRISNKEYRSPVRYLTFWILLNIGHQPAAGGLAPLALSGGIGVKLRILNPSCIKILFRAQKARGSKAQGEGCEAAETLGLYANYRKPCTGETACAALTGLMLKAALTPRACALGFAAPRFQRLMKPSLT